MSTDDNKKLTNSESSDDALINAPFADLDTFEIDTLLEEINVLDLEGYLFAFAPKQKGLRSGKHVFEMPGEEGRTLTLKFDDDYYQPSLLAYRVLQAVFKKITDEGKPFTGVANFGSRELFRLCGSEGWGGFQGQKLYHAIQSLHRTHIKAKILDKDSGTYKEVGFYLFPKVLLSGKKAEIHTCSIHLEPEIVASLNKDYWVAFNWSRLNELQPISMAFYKRLYRNFAYIYSSRLRVRKKRGGVSQRDLIAARREVSFRKRYINIVDEWFGGGVTTWRYKSELIRVLKPHMDVLKKVKLIRSWDIHKNKKGELILSFKPGIDFFRDYEKLWLGQFQPQLKFNQVKAIADVQEPLHLLSYFFEKRFDSIPSIFPKNQESFARTLLDEYGYEGAVSLIDFTIKEAKKDKFDIKTLMSAKTYISAWQASEKEMDALKEKQEKELVELKALKLKDDFQTFLDKKRDDFKKSLTEKKLSKYQAQAEKEFNTENPNVPVQMRPMGLRIRLASILLKASNPPTFEEWVNSKGG